MTKETQPLNWRQKLVAPFLKSNRAQSWRYVWQTSLKLLFVGVVCLSAYSVYLDAKIKQKFEGQRWQVPVQVFSQSLVVKKGQMVSTDELADQLKSYNYQRVTTVKRPGQYAKSSKRVIVYRRGFNFPEGPEKAQKFTINVKDNRIVELLNERNSAIEQFNVEPVLLERLVSQDKEDRVLVELQNVPEALLDTLILVEDRNFYFHHGVSITGIARAFWQNIRAGRTVQGGSTLTQQLAKNMFLTREKRIWRKINEAIMSLLLERRYSKDQLLEAYINEVYLGQHYANGIYGFGLAARFYFGRDIAQLTSSQMALLIAQVKGPSYYDPWRHPERATQRRDLVLRLMVENKIIDRADYEQSLQKPLTIRAKRKLERRKYPAYMQVVEQELKQNLPTLSTPENLRVFTGFSPWIQRQAEDAVNNQLATLEKQNKVSELQTAVVITDIENGEIRAVIGDRDSQYAGFNRAINANRSIGSLIKPVIYLAALERYERFNLASTLDDAPITMTNASGQEWKPKNYDGKYRGNVTLLQALVSSLNIPTVNLGLELGLTSLEEMLFILGYELDKELTPAMFLGAIEMPALDVNQIYLTFAKQGHYTRAHTVNKIVSARGETLWQADTFAEPRLSAQGAYLINYAMSEVAKTGTAASLTWRLKAGNVAGKTGTSNDLRDSWFVGFDNQHLVTSWIGRDDNKPMGLTGSSGAVPLYANIMKRIGVENLDLSKPSNIKMAYFDPKSGLSLRDRCEGSVLYPAVAEGIMQSGDCEQVEPKKPKKKKSWLERIFGD